MRLLRLNLTALRIIEQVNLEPGPTLNLFTGDNGAGKTSLLEGLHLLGYGRSFRGRVRDGLIRAGAPAIEVFAEWRDEAHGRTRAAGLRHCGSDWQGRLDGASVAHLGELAAAFAVVTFEPGSHALITAGSEVRRRFMDWGLFHVEPEFLGLWRRYARALKQRNALLKTRALGAHQLDAWEHELVEAGEPLTRRRQAYIEQLQPELQALVADLLPSAGAAGLHFQPGWRRDELSLADALLLARDRDFAAGFTSVGPHRADWRIEYRDLPGREGLSRGQAKLTALSALLAQASQYAQSRGEWPIFALDDLASELDQAHLRRVLAWLARSGAQIFLTGTEASAVVSELYPEHAKFHVERGSVRTA